MRRAEARRGRAGAPPYDGAAIGVQRQLRPYLPAYPAAYSLALAGMERSTLRSGTASFSICDFVGAGGERQRHLPAFGGRAAEGHHDFEAL